MLKRVFKPQIAESILDLPYDDAQIRAAMATALDNATFAGPEPDGPELARLVVQVAREFLANRDFGGAFRVLGAAPPPLRRRLPVQVLKMNLLGKLGALEPLVTELGAMLRQPSFGGPRDHILSNATSRLGLGWWLGGDCRVKPALWGPLPENPAEWVRDGAGEYLSPPAEVDTEDTAAGPLLDLLGITWPEVWIRMAAGAGPRRRASFLYQADAKARLAPAGTPGAAQIIAYHDRYVRDEIICDMGPLNAARQAGRNAILLMAHAGSAIRLSKFAEAPGPKAIIAHSIVPRPDTIWMPTLRDPSTIAMNLIRLARTIRKEPHLVILMPDGATGTASAEITVEGMRFRVGLGGAALARVAPSTLFFGRSFHRDGKLEIEITEGPQMGPGMISAESDAQFAAFYGAGLTRILHSPLEDIEGFGFLRSVQRDEEFE